MRKHRNGETNAYLIFKIHTTEYAPKKPHGRLPFFCPAAACGYLFAYNWFDGRSE